MSGIREVVREAQVSTATVSHIINNTHYVSDEFRARVEKAVEKCRYYPNAPARSRIGQKLAKFSFEHRTIKNFAGNDCY